MKPTPRILRNGSDETYAEHCTCLQCRARFGWAGMGDMLRYCPACGVAFVGEVTPSAASFRRREVACAVAARCLELREARRMTFVVQWRVVEVDCPSGWVDDDWSWTVPRATQDWKFATRPKTPFLSDREYRMVVRWPDGREVVALGPTFAPGRATLQRERKRTG